MAVQSGQLARPSTWRSFNIACEGSVVDHANSSGALKDSSGWSRESRWTGTGRPRRKVTPMWYATHRSSPPTED